MAQPLATSEPHSPTHPSSTAHPKSRNYHFEKVLAVNSSLIENMYVMHTSITGIHAERKSHVNAYMYPHVSSPGFRPPCRVYTCILYLPTLDPHRKNIYILTQCISSRFVPDSVDPAHTYIHTSRRRCSQHHAQLSTVLHTYLQIYLKDNRKTAVHTSNVSAAYLCIGLRCAAHVTSPRAAEIVLAATALRTFWCTLPVLKEGEAPERESLCRVLTSVVH